MPLRLSVFSVKTGPLITYHKGKTFFLPQNQTREADL